MNKDVIELAIDALEKAEKRHEKIRNALDFIRYGSFSRKDKDSNDGQAMADAGNNLSAARHEVTEALAQLIALQSQPATDGLGKVIKKIDGFIFDLEDDIRLTKKHTAEIITRIYKIRDAILDQQSAPTTPAGWKLVPIEPTEEMISECVDAEFGITGKHLSYRELYQAMLSAAPDLNGEG